MVSKYLQRECKKAFLKYAGAAPEEHRTIMLDLSDVPRRFHRTGQAAEKKRGKSDREPKSPGSS